MRLAKSIETPTTANEPLEFGCMRTKIMLYGEIAGTIDPLAPVTDSSTPAIPRELPRRLPNLIDRRDDPEGSSPLRPRLVWPRSLPGYTGVYAEQGERVPLSALRVDGRSLNRSG